MEETAGPRLEKARDAVVTPAQSLVSAQNIQGLFVDNEAGDEQVQLAVVVIVKPHGAGRPAGRGDAGFISQISEGAITVIVIKNIAPITRDKEIDPTIAIVIAGCGAHAKGATSDSGFVGDVSKRAVMIVVVKRIL